MADQDFSGVWHSVYRYKNPLAPGLFSSEHDVKINQQGNTLIIESLPNESKSYLVMRLKLDGRIATGTWEENTSPTGQFKGARYMGAVQFVLSEDGNMLDGMYLVAGMRAEIKSNFWEITRK